MSTNNEQRVGSFSAVAELPIPSRDETPLIPDHEVICQIGRGSYGEVWLARNKLGTLRAVKIVHRSAFEESAPFEREFRGIQKFEPISRSHPGLVNILQVGVENDWFYYVMELADNVAADVRRLSSKSEPDQSLLTSAATYKPHTLRHDLKQHGRLPPNDCIQIALQLTSALAHLHAQGLVHRDIKPSNIIFVNGAGKLADIGLVTETGDSRSIVGTEGYLPPEGPGAAQADIYSLGKVLYEMSMGRDRRDFPDLPKDWQQLPERKALLELNEVILRACAQHARDRYQSAEKLHDDLQSLQCGKSVKARHARQRTFGAVRKLALPIIACAILVAALSSPLWRATPPAIKLSRIPAANEEYQSGLIYLHTSSLDAPTQAAWRLERAVELDPGFAVGYAHLARAYIWMGAQDPQMLAKAREAALRAVSLDPRLSEAHSVLATVKLLYELDWSGAEKERLYALELNQNSDDTMVTSALNLASLGRPREAVAMIERALRIESRSVTRLRHAGNVFLWSREYDRAIQKFEQLIEVSPSIRGQIQRVNLAPAFRGKGDYLKSIQHQREGALFQGDNPDTVNRRYDALENAFKEGGATGYWRKSLDLEEAKGERKNFIFLAAIHAELRNNDAAFDWLERAFKETPPQFAFAINTNPSFDKLRSDLRWAALIDRLWRPK